MPSGAVHPNTPIMAETPRQTHIELGIVVVLAAVDCIEV